MFNPRPKHVKLLQIMKNIDPMLEIKSTIDSMLWSVPNEIPMFERYKKHFAVSQTKPPRQAQKVSIHFKLHTTCTISNLKHNPPVMMFLQEQKMWVSNDMFKTQKITTVGRITEVHPHLIWVPGLIKELTEAMKELKMPETDIAKCTRKTNTHCRIGIPQIRAVFGGYRLLEWVGFMGI
jgi:hypothetical protein